MNELQKMEKKDVFQLNASALLHATNDNTFGEYKIPNTATGIIDSYQVMSMQWQVFDGNEIGCQLIFSRIRL